MLSALCVAFSAALALAVVRRLRAPREARRPYRDRARTRAALGVDAMIARASRSTVATVAISSWGLVVLMLALFHQVAFWPCAFVSAFALRASQEWSRRSRRAVLAGAGRDKR